jgi:hypothetical protein
MAFPNPDTICSSCGMDKMIEDPINRERICKGCGLVLPLTGPEPVYASKNKSLNIKAYRLGSDRKFAFKDYAGNWIPSRVRSDLVVASKYDREQRKREQAAVSRIAELYDTIAYPMYDDGLKKVDLGIIKQRARNMVEATGERQSELDLMRIIRKFLRVKLGKNPELKEHFKLGLVRIKIRYQREQPRNISGRGNQIGKNRKEGRIEYCNLCDTDIPNYKVRKHHMENHKNIPYHQYINKRNQYVRRSASLEDISIDCSATKEKSGSKNKERGQCTNCNVSDAIIQRYPQVEITKKGRIDIVSRLVARHKDETGRWKACILQQRKIDKK